MMPASVETQRLEGIEVLAVDDNPDALDVITAALTNAGAHVRTASSGPEAVDQIRRDPPNIVLCDLAMPQMDGFHVLQRIRELDSPVGRTLPVIAVTAYASQEYHERCLEAGFQSHLSKPLRTDELIRAVAAAVT